MHFAGELPPAEDGSAATRIAAPAPEATILVQEALAHLSEREALIIIAYYLEDQSPQEIADRLGLTASNVTKIRQRAIRKLRKLLGGKREGGRDENR